MARATAKKTTLTRGSLLLTLSRTLTVVLGYLLSIFLARALGASGFGLFGVVVTVVAWFELVVAEGLPLRLARTVDREGNGPLVPRSYLIMQLGVSLALAALVVVLAPFLARLFQVQGQALLFQVSAVDIPIFALYMLAGGVLLGSRYFGPKAVVEVAYSAGKLAATAVLVLAGLYVLGAVIGGIVASIVGFVVSAGFIAFLLRGRPLFGAVADVADDAAPSADVVPDADSVGDIVNGSAQTASLLILQMLALSVGLWIIKAMLPASDAGYYRAASLMAMVPVSISGGLVWGLYASYSNARRHGDIARTKHYLSQSSRLLLTAAGLWVAAVVPTATSLLATVFSAEYGVGGPSLAVLAIGTGLGVVGMAIGPVLLIEGSGRWVVGAAAVLVIVEIAGTIALIPVLGALGAAVAATAVLLVASVASWIAMRAKIGFRVGSAPLRIGVSTALVFALALLVHPKPGITLIGWYVAFTAAYVGLLFLTRAMTLADLTDFREGLGGGD